MNRSGDAIVGECFLEVRAKLLEVAATFDRIDRGGTLDDAAQAKRDLLRQATEILLSGDADRAERLQQLFSRDYESDWRQSMGIRTSDPS